MGKKEEIAEDVILWKDRRRRLGLPLSFTRYEVTEDRFFLRKGFFKTVIDEILIYRILDIKLVRTLGQKFFGVGTITLFSADQSLPKLDLINIKKSEAVRKFLSKLIEQQRAAKGITSRELLRYGDTHGHHDDDHLHVHDHEFIDRDGDGIPD